MAALKKCYLNYRYYDRYNNRNRYIHIMFVKKMVIIRTTTSVYIDIIDASIKYSVIRIEPI